MPSVPRTLPASARWLALVAAIALLAPSLVSLQAWQAPPAAAEVTDDQLAAGGVLRDSQDYRVAPGLDLTTFSRLEEGGWKEGCVLTESTLSVDVTDDGTVTGRSPLTDVRMGTSQAMPAPRSPTVRPRSRPSPPPAT